MSAAVPRRVGFVSEYKATMCRLCVVAKFVRSGEGDGKRLSHAEVVTVIIPKSMT